MATINDHETVRKIISNNGYHKGDIRVVKIVQYNNMFNGGLAYGLIYKGEDRERYHNSGACHNPITLWEATD